MNENEVKIFLGKCTIKNNILKIKAKALTYKGIRKIKFNKEIEVIEKEAFAHNKIKKLSLPNTINSVGEAAFQSNHISTLKLSENMSEVSINCFIDNDLVTLDIPNNIVRLRDKCFRFNKLKDVQFHEGLEVIEKEVFYDNKIEEIILPDSTNYVGVRAFERNNIKYVKLGNELTQIKSAAFAKNKIEKIDFNNNLIVIDNEAFAYNSLKEINIPECIKILGYNCFSNNKLEKVTISAQLETIPKAAFAYNNIKELKLNEGLKIIDDRAFYGNNINEIILPNGIEVIGLYAFRNNQINHINIPDTVKKINAGAFDIDTNITYKGITFSKEIIRRFGSQNIIKLALMKKMNPSLDLLEIDSFELDLIPNDNDSIKGYIQNRNRFLDLQKKLGIRNGQGFNNLDTLYEYQKFNDFIRFCYIIGYFKSNGKQLDEIDAMITWVYEIYSKVDIHNLMLNIEVSKYIPKVASIILNAIKDPHTFDTLKYSLKPFYDNYNEISKGVIKKRQNEVTAENTNRRRLIEAGADTTEIDNKINNLKKELKNYLIDDVAKFIRNNIFKINEGNEELLDIINILSGEINKFEFEEIQAIFEQAKKTEDNRVLKTLSENKGKFTYEWLKNDDPTNLVLGYYVDCCAKIGSTGEDIMRQSMINPKVKNLVIYDSCKKIIGKSTAYYNSDQKYILCNNIEISKSFLSNKKTTDQMKEEVTETIIAGLLAQIEAIEGEVNEVRIGLLRNDLINELKRIALFVEKKYLLDNYDWRNYSGDANSEAYGQAVVYKK